ncbi:MAG: glycosyl transferase [Proteobacteria bacterium]|nr:glycosyl transferase [Pseudomonadota bacterium]
MKIVHYCQHVLGIGHFVRSLEICKAFEGHEVYLVTGGPRINAPLPSHVREVRLPGLMMDRDFKNLFTTDDERSIEQVKEERLKLLLHLFEKGAPNLFIVELYPFGRKAFRFELDPILQGIRNKELPKSRVVCSLRDILVEKGDSVSYEKGVVSVLNSCFDAVLVHADPSVIKLDETFSSTGDIVIPIVYTGFVTAKPAPYARIHLRRQLGINETEFLVVASAGGGKVGFPLLEAVMQAVRFMESRNSLYLHIFAGSFMSREEFGRLKSLSSKRMRVFRFTPDFVSYLAAADLSVSMTGYNTSMNVLAAGVPALVWPFSQNREQRLRAERLSRLGALEAIEDDDLEPARLATIMGRALCRGPQVPVTIDLEGAANTARWLEQWMEDSRRL